MVQILAQRIRTKNIIFRDGREEGWINRPEFFHIPNSGGFRNFFKPQHTLSFFFIVPFLPYRDHFGGNFRISLTMSYYPSKLLLNLLITCIIFNQYNLNTSSEKYSKVFNLSKTNLHIFWELSRIFRGGINQNVFLMF